MDATIHDPAVAVLFDFENVTKSFRQRIFKPEKFSMEAGFDDLINHITQVGKIAMFCIFVPDHLIVHGNITKKDLEFFQKKGFFTIVCPKIGPEEKDTSDFNMIRWGLDVMLPYFSKITHLCIGSGDVDFEKLCKQAKEKSGLKIMVTGGSTKSLSRDIRRIADIHPKTGEKMVYLFSPIRK